MNTSAASRGVICFSRKSEMEGMSPPDGLLGVYRRRAAAHVMFSMLPRPSMKAFTG